MAIIIHKKDGSEVSAGTSLMYNAGFDEKPEVQYQTRMPWDTPPQRAMRATYQAGEPVPPRGVSSATRIIMTRPITGDDVRDHVWYTTSVALDLLVAAKESLKDKLPLWQAFLSELKILERKLFNMPETIRNTQVCLREMARIAQKYSVPISAEIFNAATKKVPQSSGALSGSPYDSSMGTLGMGFFKKLGKFVKKTAKRAGGAVKSGVKKLVVQPTKFIAKKTTQAGKFAAQKTKQAGKFAVQKTKQGAKFVAQKAKQAAKWVKQKVLSLLNGLKGVFVKQIVNRGKGFVTAAFKKVGLSGSSFGNMGYIGVNSGDFGYDRMGYLSNGMGAVDAGALTTEFAKDYISKKWTQILAVLGGSLAAGGGIASAATASAAFAAKILPDAVADLKKFAANKAQQEAAKVAAVVEKPMQKVQNQLPSSEQESDDEGEEEQFEDYEENTEEQG